MKPLKPLSIMLLLALSFALNAQVETKRILSQNSYRIGKEAELSIIHKFGTITIINHDAERIDAEVVANIKVSNEAEIEKLLDNISLIMSGNENGLRIETIFDDDMAGNRKNSATIDIIIQMPDFVNVSIEHKFGKTTIESIAGIANLNSEYGKLEIKSLGDNNNKIKILQGTASISSLVNASIKTEHSSIDIGYAGDAKIESIFSTFKCETAGTLRMTLEGGRVELKNVGRLRVTSSFSGIEVQNLEFLLISEAEYTNILVKNINQSFDNIEIDAAFSTVDLNFGSNPDFNVSGQLSFSKISYPDSEWPKVTKSKEDKNIMLNGFTGNGKTPSSVKLTCNYGSVHLR